MNSGPASSGTGSAGTTSTMPCAATGSGPGRRCRADARRAHGPGSPRGLGAAAARRSAGRRGAMRQRYEKKIRRQRVACPCCGPRVYGRLSSRLKGTLENERRAQPARPGCSGRACPAAAQLEVLPRFRFPPAGRPGKRPANDSGHRVKLTAGPQTRTLSSYSRERSFLTRVH